MESEFQWSKAKRSKEKQRHSEREKERQAQIHLVDNYYESKWEKNRRFYCYWPFNRDA